MRRRNLISLIGITVLAIGSLALTIGLGYAPKLGLDLQGGASVTLLPEGNVSGDSLSQAVQIIRQRVDALGVAEPEITRQGDAIVVNLPGVKDQDKALQIVGQTAELRFRPVLEQLPPAAGSADTTTTVGGATTTAAASATTVPSATTVAGATTTVAGATTTSVAPTDVATTPVAEDDATKEVVLPDKDGTSRYRLGPA